MAQQLDPITAAIQSWSQSAFGGLDTNTQNAASINANRGSFQGGAPATSAVAPAPTAPQIMPDVAAHPYAALQADDIDPNTGRPRLSENAQRELNNARSRDQASAASSGYALQSNAMQVPVDPSDPKFLDIQEKRANALGVGDLWRKFQREAPGALRPSDNSSVDQNMLQDPTTKKIMPSDSLHNIFNSPQFQELYRQQPDKAAALYSAVTPGGRNLHLDVASKQEQLVSQKAAGDKHIEGIKSLRSDPVTGNMLKTVMVKQPDGSMAEQEMPISPLDKAVIAQRGGTRGIYGVDLPGARGLARLPGTTDEEHGKYQVATAQELKSKGITDPTPEQLTAAAQTAHQKMFDAQNAPPSDLMGRLTRTGDVLGNAAISGINAGSDQLNRLLQMGGITSNAPIPILPHPAPSGKAPSIDFRNLLSKLQTTTAGPY